MARPLAHESKWLTFLVIFSAILSLWKEKPIRSDSSSSQMNSTQTYLSKYTIPITTCMREARFDLGACIMPSSATKSATTTTKTTTTTTT